MPRPDNASAELEALFQEQILEHYRRPHNKGPLVGATSSGSAVNSTCGDEITVEVTVVGDVVRAARFTGRGCSISQASASMMTTAAEGRTRDEIREIAQRFRAMLRGGYTPDADQLGDLRALGGVSRFPARLPCALMAWRALTIALG